MFWNVLDCVRPISKETLQKYPTLWHFYTSTAQKPNMQKYLTSDRRPKTITSSMAPFGGTPETS